MAVLKHLVSRNADYGAAQRYLLFRHDEYTNRPILGETGEPVLREAYFMDGIHCDPFTFDLECKELNAQYHKNQAYDDIKSHHYIISFDPEDVTECGLDGEKAQQLGLEFARGNFPGHQALVCTHMDGHNGSGNIHVHLVINSLRKCDVEHRDFMERPCDSRAGYKHHVTRDYLVHLKQSLMELCHRENLHQVDLLAPAGQKITDREYHAGRRGQTKLDARNRQILADGITPRTTTFQTQKDFLRAAIEDVAAMSHSREEFQGLLLEKYHVIVKISRGRFSYLHPERGKFITGRQLGTQYETEHLLKLFEENATGQKRKGKQADMPERYSTETKPPVNGLPDTAYGEAVLLIKSDLRLVIHLQDCVKAQQNAAYASKVKLSNLKEMARTIAYIQEHGYDTRDSLEESFSEIKRLAADSRKELRSIEGRLRQTNEQIRYTGQYFAGKSVWQQFCRAKNRGQFRKEHSAEIALYETARKFLKEHASDGRLPSMQLLKAEKEQLQQQKNEAQKTCRYYREYQKELATVLANVEMISGRPHNRQEKKQKSAGRS